MGIYSGGNLSDWAKGILKSSKAGTHYDLSEDLLEKISDKDEPSELMAVAKIPEDDLSRIPLGYNPLIVVFDSPASPGNLGTLIRSCDAFGADGLIITGHATDAYDPETIRATTGSLFSVPIVWLPSSKEFVIWLEMLRGKYPDLQVVGTDEKGKQNHYEFNFNRPTILLVGNEKRGLSVAYNEIADGMVNIPMEGTASSLNVAVATSIILSEVKRQRAG